MAKLCSQVIDTLKEKLDAVTSNPDGIPGLVMIAIDRNGDYVFEHASGTIGLGVNKPMTLDTVFWTASCTKILVSIAAMQLVEQGKLALDDIDLVETLAPELKDVKVLEEDPSGELRLVEKIGGITLRMLLTHTGMTTYLSLGKAHRNPF
jgi:CubicO group peptidase (beta-lactamase class C family)